MKNKREKLYGYIVDSLSKSPLYRSALINEVIKNCRLCEEKLNDLSPNSEKNRIRSDVGMLINEMHERALIGVDSAGKYYLISEKPVIIRIEKCQKEIIKALTEKKHTKAELYQRLSLLFGTDKTVTKKDDGILASYISKLVKNMETNGAVIFEKGYYSLTPKISAKSDDVNAILTLKGEFILKLHAKGGEFLENYFMGLIEKYCEKHEKRVLECYVTGGSDDGGIDGIIKTEDLLGFREVIMVQTKNRVEFSGETDVRGFYGAVCAKKGSRGIFVTTSDFHSSAQAFLDSLDDCVGINGDRIFAMAIECGYGIKKSGKLYVIDDKIL